MAGGQDERVLLGQLGLAYGAFRRLGVVGQRVVAEGLHSGAEELDATGGGGEPGLAVGAQHALLVLLVHGLAGLAARLG